MKKNLLAALLVAILASSMVFAGFKGSATAAFGWDIDNKTFGFKNTSDPNITLTLATENGEKVGEGKVYGEIKATLALSLDKVTGEGKKVGALTAEIKNFEANVVGNQWKVSILGAMGNNDFAASYSKNDSGKSIWNYELSTAKLPGVTVTVYDYMIGVGLNKGYDTTSGNGALLSFLTPKYTLAEGLTAQAGAAASVATKDFKNGAYGFGGNVAYAKDALKASVAADMGLNVTDGEVKFNADVAANVGYSPVALDVYFATEPTTKPVPVKNLLNTKVSVTLDDYVGMPLSFYVDLIDLVNDARNLEANVSAKFLEKKLDCGLTYKTNMQKPLSWSIKANAGYNFGVAKVAGDVTYASAKTLAFNFSASSDTLINNATLKLAYEGLTFNFNEGQDHKAGAVVASCKISF